MAMLAEQTHVERPPLIEARGMRIARYVRLYADAAGELHFEEVEVPLAALDFAPPAHPMNLSAFTPATRWAFFEIPSG